MGEITRLSCFLLLASSLHLTSGALATDYPPTTLETLPSTEGATPTPVPGREVCPAYPNATEHINPVPHVDNIISYSCGEYFDCKSGGIFYKPFEAVEANERCVWTIAVPSARGYDVTVQYYGYQPNENNADDHGLIISDFGHSRAPKHLVPTTTNTTTILNANMLLITFFTGSEPSPSHSGFILQFKARMDGTISKAVNATSKHLFIGSEQYFLNNGAFVLNELSTYLFLPKDNIYRPGRENRAVYMPSYGTYLHCSYDQLKVYYFNTTCVGPHKWQYQGRLCGASTPSYEMLRSPKPMLVVFETTTRALSPSFIFTYNAHC